MKRYGTYITVFKISSSWYFSGWKKDGNFLKFFDKNTIDYILIFFNQNIIRLHAVWIAWPSTKYFEMIRWLSVSSINVLCIYVVDSILYLCYKLNEISETNQKYYRFSKTGSFVYFFKRNGVLKDLPCRLFAGINAK